MNMEPYTVFDLTCMPHSTIQYGNYITIKKHWYILYLLNFRKTLPLVEVAIILILTLINSIVCVKEEQLKTTELSRKIGKFLNQCQRKWNCFTKMSVAMF